MNVTIDLITLKGPLLITTAYFVLWYSMLFGLQSRTKYKLIAEYRSRGEKFDRYFGQDGRMLAADRAVANTQEQMVPFLFAMWLHALFVSPSLATALGAIYVLLRAVYPFLLGNTVSRTQSKRVLFATAPCYAIVFFMLGSAVFTALNAAR